MLFRWWVMKEDSVCSIFATAIIPFLPVGIILSRHLITVSLGRTTVTVFSVKSLDLVRNGTAASCDKGMPSGASRLRCPK